MFRKLHIQMTLFSTLITSAILIAMTLICLFIAENGARRNYYSSFSENAGSCIIHLEGQTVLSHRWILQAQETYGIFLKILDNGNSLFFDKLHSSRKMEEAFSKAEQISREEYALNLSVPGRNSAITQTVFFRMENYYACTAIIPKTGGALSLIILCPLDAMRSQLTSQRLAFGTAVILAILAMSVFSWFFTRKMIRPLEENRRAQTEFIASASHELRSPLTVIQSGISALQSRLSSSEETEEDPAKTIGSFSSPCVPASSPRQDPSANDLPGNSSASAEVQGFLSVISRESLRMGRLINDMLTLANADNHSWTFSPSPCEMDTLVLETFEAFQLPAREHRIRFRISLPENELPPCCCDAARISQILSILLDNAFAYVPENGTVTLALRYEHRRFLLSVSDNGPGIPDSQKEAVFRRFYRMDTSRTDKQHFGLGLSIAREIALLHHGTLTAADAPQGGASFLLSLPA